jgi:hypothetical protein
VEVQETIMKECPGLLISASLDFECYIHHWGINVGNVYLGAFLEQIQVFQRFSEKRFFTTSSLDIGIAR